MAAALADLLLTQQGLVPSHALFVRSFDLTRHGLHCTHAFARTQHSTLQRLPFRCLPSLSSTLRWKNSRLCSSPMAPHGCITLTTRVSGPQHYIVSNSYKLVRAPRRLCSHWPPHWSPVAQRLQAPCPANSYHAVPSAHKFRRPTLSMSQAM